MTKLSKLSGFSVFLVSTVLSAAAFGAGADDPSQRFIDRLAGKESSSAIESTSVADDVTSNPAQSFLDRLAGKQTPASEPSDIADAGNPARDFIDRLAGVPVTPAKKDARIVEADDSARRLTSVEPDILAR